ncbi:hypothetical protein R6U77_03470 [Lysinibacillus louembei]|uniref:VanZ-like domain-containing protein n=1 Tax=Lysinibacillus louembei TaxID=1470088 RepID=A0ABZ0RZ83_9BACI|nr:hypothetical protein [Lysinibacillus louembei]WPK12775.1 hypothetical protein R6U77_03470 [Lysinibacillus louembei]
MTTSFIYNVVPFGIILLLVYAFIDIFLDYFRKSQTDKVHRFVFYGFLFYLINLVQIRWGGLIFPAKNTDTLNVLVSSNASKTNTIYETLYTVAASYHSLAIIYNMLLWIPVGIFAALLFNKQPLKKSLVIVLISCFSLELMEFALAYFGFIFKSTSLLNILTLAGSMLGVVIGTWIVKTLPLTRRAAY